MKSMRLIKPLQTAYRIRGPIWALAVVLFSWQVQSAQLCEQTFFQANPTLESALFFNKKGVVVSSVELSNKVKFGTIDSWPLRRLFDELFRLNTFASGASLRPRSLLYMASGQDSITPFMMFSSIESVVAVDVYPFFESREQLVPGRGIVNSEAQFDRWDMVSESKTMAEGLVGRILMAFPRARIREIKLFTDYQNQKDGLPLRHGLIVWDEGENTPVRRILYLQSLDDLISAHASQTSVTSTRLYSIRLSFQKPAFLEALLKTKFDALLAKGSMAAYGFETAVRIRVNSDAGPGMGSMLWKKFYQNGGLIVDADGTHWPFLNEDGSVQSSRVNELGPLPFFDLGYSELRIFKVGAEQ